jgi:hypothetical protein
MSGADVVVLVLWDDEGIRSSKLVITSDAEGFNDLREHIEQVANAQEYQTLITID